ncbi:hypothetical protein D9M69_529790 [compost metagenome]
MVEGTIDRPQAPRHLRVGQQRRQFLTGRMGFSDEDLLENELEVRLDEVGHFVFLNSTTIDQAESRPRGCDSTFLRRRSMKPGKSKSRPNPPSLFRSSVPTGVICPCQHRAAGGSLTQVPGGPWKRIREKAQVDGPAGPLREIEALLMMTFSLAL